MSQLPLYIHGHGAVSAAGLDSASLYQACLDQTELPVTEREYPLGTDVSIRYRGRQVDTKALRGTLPKAPRLRRASNVTKFMMSAALQAVPQERVEQSQSDEFRLGIVVAFMNGCVNYSCRFFAEVLEEPAHASPLIFPETVFNAPASHVASHLACDGPVYTLIGDSATWFSAITTARDWLQNDLADGCLILAGEELDRLTSEALGLYSRQLIPTEGAAALYLETNPSPVLLSELHGPFPYVTGDERRTAIAKAVAKTPSDSTLVDGLTGIDRTDRDELAATASLSNQRLSPLLTLGEPMGLRSGFQTIAALESLKSDQSRTSVLACGGNQHAFTAVFEKL